MIRTLTLVTLLALLAGAAVGFFVSQCHAAGATVSAPPESDPVVEEKVRQYADAYALSTADAADIRVALKDYNQGLLDLLRHLRVEHSKEFKDLSEKANTRID